MFDSGHPGNVFVPKQDEVTGGWLEEIT
jgi:hypothetical protein